MAVYALHVMSFCLDRDISSRLVHRLQLCPSQPHWVSRNISYSFHLGLQQSNHCFSHLLHLRIVRVPQVEQLQRILLAVKELPFLLLSPRLGSGQSVTLGIPEDQLVALSSDPVMSLKDMSAWLENRVRGGERE